MSEPPSICCKNGKISLPKMVVQEGLKWLLSSPCSRAKRFRKNIRMYNAAYSFTSLGVKMDERIRGSGVFNFRIHGEIYHLIGDLFPQEHQQPCFAQVYFYDTDFQNRTRLAFSSRFETATIQDLTNIMMENPITQCLLHNKDSMNCSNASMEFRYRAGALSFHFSMQQSTYIYQ